MNEQIVNVTRVFDAPRSRVFECWTRAEHLVHWFGPKGFTIHSCEADPRPGGVFRLCLRSPDGKDYWVLQEIIDVTFTESRGKTTVAVNATARGPGDEAAAMLKGMEKGWAQTVSRLDTHLRK